MSFPARNNREPFDESPMTQVKDHIMRTGLLPPFFCTQLAMQIGGGGEKRGNGLRFMHVPGKICCWIAIDQHPIPFFP